jgi:hypothetical protein
MSKPKQNKPKGQRSQNPIKKTDGKPVDAAAVMAETLAPVDSLSAVEAVPEPAATVAASAEPLPEPAATVSAPQQAALTSADKVSASANTVSTPANTFSNGIQTIAAAYGDYTKKSFEDTRCFVEKLAGVRSFDKAVQVQAEYAKTAYETFVAESRKIRQLYSDLATQTLKPREGVASKTRAS